MKKITDIKSVQDGAIIGFQSSEKCKFVIIKEADKNKYILCDFAGGGAERILPKYCGPFKSLKTLLEYIFRLSTITSRHEIYQFKTKKELLKWLAK